MGSIHGKPLAYKNRNNTRKFNGDRSNREVQLRRDESREHCRELILNVDNNTKNDKGMGNEHEEVVGTRKLLKHIVDMRHKRDRE